jgi:hypothetical protein
LDDSSTDLGAGSDSDVRLAPVGDTDPGSDSDVRLVDEDETATAELSSDSDVALIPAEGDGLSIVLGGDDDDESVLSDGSGIELSAESGLSRENLDDGDEKDTELEIPSFDSDGDSEFELRLDDSAMDSAGDSSVLLFDDEDEDPDEHSQTVVKKSSDFEDAEGETFDITEGDDDGFDLEEDEFDDDDDLDISDDVIGEDDELDDLDVFDADDDVFDDAMGSGESHAEFAATGRGRVEVAPQEAEWGGGTFAGLLVSTGLMALCTMLMYDLVRGMWAWNEPSSFNSGLLEVLSGLFG